MTKKTFLSLVGGAVAIVAVAGVAVNNANSTTKMSDLMIKNLEALSQNEGGSGGGCGFAAYQYDDDWYEDSKNFRRCGDCEWVSGTKPQYTQC
ncbi:MAG: NVEALA domain-containing protein [Alistipes sp.]|nr:NVEALA domain-containing protein [Alistipes sp.]